MRAITKLSGINHVAYFDNIIGKKILLLGEQHELTGICQEDNPNAIEIHEYLYELATQYPDCIDIFLESPYITKDTKLSLIREPLKKVNAPVNAVRNMFSELMRKDKKPKKYKNVRFHYVDLRFINNYDYSPIGLLIKLDIVQNEGINLIHYFDYFQDIIHYITFGFNEKVNTEAGRLYLYDLFYQLAQDDEYVLGQLNQMIDDYFKWYFQLIKKEIAKLDKRIDPKLFLITFHMVSVERFNSEMNKMEDKDYNHIEELLLYIEQALMDLYILLRMFITYDSSKLQRGPKGCHNFNNAKTIVFEGGNLHSLLYAKVIQDYFEIAPDIDDYIPPEVGREWQCVDFVDPFGVINKIQGRTEFGPRYGTYYNPLYEDEDIV